MPFLEDCCPCGRVKTDHDIKVADGVLHLCKACYAESGKIMRRLSVLLGSTQYVQAVMAHHAEQDSNATPA